jgi:hypothetical protein
MSYSLVIVKPGNAGVNRPVAVQFCQGYHKADKKAEDARADAV